MADFSSLDDPVDVEAVMAEIRRKVREEFHAAFDASALPRDIEYIMDNCRLERSAVGARDSGDKRPILSRPIANALERELRRSLDPLLAKQTLWNRKVAYVLKYQQEELERLKAAAGMSAQTEADARPAAADESEGAFDDPGDDAGE